MKILVGVKRIIDYNVQVRVRSDNSDVDLSNTKMAMNPSCEIAVEEAIRLKEKGIATEIIAISIGPKGAQEQLRIALALGVDRAIHVQSEEQVDPLDVDSLTVNPLTLPADEARKLAQQASLSAGANQAAACTLASVTKGASNNGFCPTGLGIML